MKTTLFALCLIMAAAGSSLAQSYRAPIEQTHPKQQKVRPAPPLTHTEVDGVIPRGVRGGNFLQMFNPKAPARYGTSKDAIVFQPRWLGASFEEEKWKGIKFFEFRF